MDYTQYLEYKRRCSEYEKIRYKLDIIEDIKESLSKNDNSFLVIDSSEADVKSLELDAYEYDYILNNLQGDLREKLKEV